jgi:acetyl-CoA C-acetyltransferase
MPGKNIWILPGPRTPFTKVDGELSHLDAIAMSVPVARAALGDGQPRPDFVAWGAVTPSLTYSNLAREVMMDAGCDPSIPSFSTIMACSTSMTAAIQMGAFLGTGHGDRALVGGVESMSEVQIGLGQRLSTWVRKVGQARSFSDRLSRAASLGLGDVKLHIPSVTNRTTGKSMGEHCEEMAKTWQISRERQDQVAYDSHRNAVAAWEAGFFDDLVVEVNGTREDGFPRADTSLEKLARLKPAFDRTSGQGTLTAGNSSPLTDGAASLWLATNDGLGAFGSHVPRVKLVDWELAGVDLHTEGLLMAPAYAIPRLLARHGLRYEDVGLWEIHEAFAAQVLCNVAALEDPTFRASKAGVDADLGAFPWERLNPNGGSVALGHPFAATGARILSQAAKELAAMPKGTRAIVSICADGGLGSVCLLESAG